MFLMVMAMDIMAMAMAMDMVTQTAEATEVAVAEIVSHRILRLGRRTTEIHTIWGSCLKMATLRLTVRRSLRRKKQTKAMQKSLWRRNRRRLPKSGKRHI